MDEIFTSPKKAMKPNDDFWNLAGIALIVFACLSPLVALAMFGIR